jgi:hypothetical protein
MTAFRSLALIGIVLISAVSSATAPLDKKSEFRKGVVVEFTYHQPLEGVYSTGWWTRLEKRDGTWRDVYFETSDKYVNKGILSFNCVDSKAAIGIIKYGISEYGSDIARETVTVRSHQRKLWAAGRLETLEGEAPPYKLFVKSYRRYC